MRSYQQVLDTTAAAECRRAVAAIESTPRVAGAQEALLKKLRLARERTRAMDAARKVDWSVVTRQSTV